MIGEGGKGHPPSIPPARTPLATATTIYRSSMLLRLQLKDEQSHMLGVNPPYCYFASCVLVCTPTSPLTPPLIITQ